MESAMHLDHGHDTNTSNDTSNATRDSPASTLVKQELSADIEIAVGLAADGLKSMKIIKSNKFPSLSDLPEEIVVMIMREVGATIPTYQRKEHNNLPKGFRSRPAKRRRENEVKNEALSLLLGLGSTCGRFRNAALAVFWENTMFKCLQGSKYSSDDLRMSPAIQTAWASMVLRRFELPDMLELHVQHLTVDMGMLYTLVGHPRFKNVSLNTLVSVKELTLCCNNFDLPAGSCYHEDRSLRTVIDNGFDLYIQPTPVVMRDWGRFLAVFGQTLRKIIIQRHPVTVGGLIRDTAFIARNAGTRQNTMGPMTSWTGRMYAQDLDAWAWRPVPLLLLEFRLDHCEALLKRLDEIFCEDVRTLISMKNLDDHCSEEDESQRIAYQNRLPIENGWFSG